MNLRTKVILVIAIFIVFSALGLYPLAAARYGITKPEFLTGQQLKLGLDLKGGVHLVLRVQTDDALRLETEQTMERLRADLMTKGIVVSNITMPDSTHFIVAGAPPDKDAAFRAAATEVQANFDRSSGSSGTYT